MQKGDLTMSNKKISKPDYIGLPKNDNKLNIQKSNPMQTLSETALSLSEFKILDAYLSRIDTHNPEKRVVRFEKGELEKMLGVDRIRQDVLEQRLKNLFQVVTIRDARKPKGFKLVALFEQAEAEQDENGLWQVNLECTGKAMEYIFNVDTMGYLPYMLKNIIELTSRYSYVLYLYLEKNRFRKSWRVDIDELKSMLNCTADTYSEYKRFNDLVLKKCHKELNEKTTIKYTYTPCNRKNRKYTAIQFTLETISDKLIQNMDNMPKIVPNLDDTSNGNELPEIDYGDDFAELLGETCNNEFSPQEINVLRDLVIKYIGHDAIKCSDYLTEKLNVMGLYPEIKNRFKYLTTIIKNDIKSK